MDREYFSTQVAEALGNARGVVEAEHDLMNDGRLEFGMKRQLQDIHNEDEQHVRNLEQALTVIGQPSDVERCIERGERMIKQIITISGDDPLELLKGTILAKYRLADSQELFYNLCDELGVSNVCELFEANLEEEEDHLDYLREQAMLLARERITGESVSR